MKSNQFGEPGNDDFTVELSIKFTENYPEGIPETTIDGIDEQFEVTRIFEAIEKMKAVAEENLCMVMVFSIVSAMQEEIEELLNVKRRRLLEIEQKIGKCCDAEEFTRLEGEIRCGAEGGK
ncbi:unnamed protein product [Caenorhabditis angaria]|uniref:RWD domain-containing protein n=1 Tax=Caenorhabditis angaria TaxID=860376 RepID=A0A9P1IES8_9PELO|nr:unnamed protein product [Caenorhabditis angaria]